MKTPRSTALAERLIVLTCLCAAAYFTGYAAAEYFRPVPTLRECPRLEYKPQAYPLSKEERRMFINYYRRSL